MSDKDLLVVISEMLRKQDQQAEKLDEHSAILNHHTEILNHQSEILERNTDILNKQIDVSNKQTVAIEATNQTLKAFMNLSEEQFNQQDTFSAQFLGTLKQQDARFSAQFEKQNEFNERLLNKLDEIAKKL
jgi:hypothetical protein